MTTSVTERPAAVAAATSSGWFRGDVDGLRAIAILLVVGYHADLPLFGGGFVGVDVFFVISGFLISRNLLRESESTERVGLGGFWSRRIRRLVPALALVVITTLIAGSFILPAFDLETFAQQGAAAALYVSNMVFATSAQDYFAADVSTSPFLHTWSLGVEEQFYLVWPVIFAVVCLLLRNRYAVYAAPLRRRILTVLFGVTLVLSLALSVSLTASGSTWAFFGLPSRTWEFAVAGLLAVVPVPALLRRVAARTVLGIAGLAILVVGLFLISDATAYPGLWALLPVGATVLIILAGETFGGAVEPGPLSRLLALPPAQWMGRVSYSWYLWHWPAIVLVVAATRDTTKIRSVAALASLPVAWLAYKYFETPLRFSSLLARSHRRTYVMGAAITAVVLIVAGAVWLQAPKVATDLLAVEEAPPGASLDERVASNVERYRARVESTCPVNGIKTVDGDLYCEGGDPGGTRTVMLMGDSHAGQWRDVLDAVAKANGVKLLVRQHSGCAPYKGVLFDDRQGGAGNADKALICTRQQEGDIRVLDALKPDAVIVAAATINREQVLDERGALTDQANQERIWRAGVSDLLDQLTSRGIEVGWILDEPGLDKNASQCIVAEQSVDACVPSRDTALFLSGPLLAIERDELAERGIDATIDMTALICDESRCNLELDGVLVYVDSHHLTDAYAARQQAAVERLVQQLGVT